MKYVCSVCGYIYDDAKKPVPFEELPAGYRCPACGAEKSAFRQQPERTDITKEEAK